MSFEGPLDVAVGVFDKKGTDTAIRPVMQRKNEVTSYFGVLKGSFRFEFEDFV